MNTALFTLEPQTLTRQDIIEYEPVLKSALKNLVRFRSSSLIFPTHPPEDTGPSATHPHGQAVLDTDRLELPLTHRGKLLAIFAARGLDLEQIRPAAPFLPLMASLCLEQILLRKQAITDCLTGLFNRACLHQALTHEISGILGSIMPGPDAVADESLHAHSACFGLILVDLNRFRRINDTYGHLFGDTLLKLTAERMRDICPKQTLLCRLDGDTFAVLWPQASRARVADLARSLEAGLATVSARFAPLREDVTISASIGFVNYPQDLRGAQFRKAPEEQSRLVLEKAEKALVAAKAGGRGQVYSFSQILAQGGAVLDVMPMNRLVINLGRGVDAHEGQRFLVWSREFTGSETIVEAQGDPVLGHYPPMCKGEISLVEVQDEMAIAEILFQTDPNWSVEKGDKLTLLDDRAGLTDQARPEEDAPQKDPLTGLYPYRDFLRAWNAARAQAKSFCLVLLRLEAPHGLRSPLAQMRDEHHLQILTARAAALFGAHALGGRYSMTGIIYHVPDLEQTECIHLVRELLADERLSGLDATAGIASFPFLDHSRSEILENARKAMDHAAMLTDEKIACFDSVSLNISADRLFAQDELFDAIAEYKKALSADENNFLARNSLGICYARLGKFATARTIFQDLIQRDPGHVMPLYNYGCACLKDGDQDAARRAFEAVLAIQPEHIYALVRLGLMAEDAADLDTAWTLYERVRTMPDGDRLAYRFLARLAVRRGERDMAREYLHQAITTNPQDSSSFHLLATLYLERGDDPEIAESLARQSVHLKGDFPPFWDVLVTALEQQGKHDEARQTKIRAMAQTG